MLRKYVRGTEKRVSDFGVSGIAEEHVREEGIS